ncbi:hypothetical protein Tco_0705355 [Tanacetum coccineum]|uniref:Uncharacterized protein n=1 Tax=Tanacetum coccineum TaxID=301880 RepID=A0ABQ4Y4K9_9ASTR
MSDLEHSTVTYTSISSDVDPLAWAVDFFGLQEPESLEAAMKEPPPPDFVPKPVYLEFMSPKDDVLPTKERPLPAAVSPTTDSPSYITEFNPEEDPEEDLEEDPEEDDEDLEDDPADYPADRDDDKEEE